MDEFDIVRAWFAPLARSPGAAGLTDDVAELSDARTLAGERLIVTTDTIVEGTHFLPGAPPELVAAKLVRTNVSDIVAKGGRPGGALLSLVWPRGRPAADIEAFASGIGKHLDAWGAHLLGGDTTSTDGPLVAGLTLLGSCGPRGPVRRSGARAGDDLWVTGEIGDGWLGLQAALDRLPGLHPDLLAAVRMRYEVPEPPPLGFAPVVGESASASADVSDGLLADIGHIARASGVRMIVRLGDVPLSAAGDAWLRTSGADRLRLATGGDDYQTVFCAAPDQRDRLARDAAALGVRLTRIGEALTGAGLAVLDEAGTEIAPGTTGWRHFP